MKTDLSSSPADAEFVFAETKEVVTEGPLGPVRHLDPVVCDFCMDSRVVWSYPAQSFSWNDPFSGSSQGDWACCDICSGLIEADERLALRDRSLKSWGQRKGDAPPFVSQSVEEIHGGFFLHRTGPRRKAPGRYGMGGRNGP